MTNIKQPVDYTNTECCFNCSHARDQWCAAGGNEDYYYTHMEPLYAEGKWTDCPGYAVVDKCVK